MIKNVSSQSTVNFGIVIGGSREFTDYSYFCKIVDAVRITLPQPDQGVYKTHAIISGGAKGTDTLAQQYAKDRGLPFVLHKPDWDTFGKRAGMLRNKTMIDQAMYGVFFWNMSSKGTAGAIRYASEVLVERVHFKEDIVKIPHYHIIIIDEDL